MLVHAAGNAQAAVDPASSAAPVGQTFTVSVTLNNVNNLIGYDVVLNYDPTVMSCISEASPNIFGMSNFPVSGHNFCSDPTVSAEAAAVSIGGSSVSLATPTAIMTLTFRVLASSIVPIHISSAQLVALVGGVVTAVPTDTSDGQFGVPPTLVFVKPNATASPRTSIQYEGNTPHPVITTLQGFILMTSSNVRAGFGGVMFDVIAPNGHDYPVKSNIVFLFPGQSATVTAKFDFTANGNAWGTYHILVTMLSCTDPASCVTAQTATGLTMILLQGQCENC